MDQENRPNLTEEEIKDCVKLAKKINFLQMNQRFPVITRLISENMVLVRECNALRARLNLEPLPVFENK